MANPIAGLSGLGSAEVRSVPGPARIAMQVAAEAISVGRACGFEVEPIYGIDTQRFVDAATGRGTDQLLADMAAGTKGLAGGRPSMLQDVMRGRRTEIDYLNGYLVDQGRRVGVRTPFNEMIVHLIHQHGVGTLKPSPEHLDPLIRMLPG
jgi:2-dehydropantoate 2-reductase